MKDKINSEKTQEGYSDVSYEDMRRVDETLANIIAKHLRAFLKASSDCLKIIDRFYEESSETWEKIKIKTSGNELNNNDNELRYIIRNGFNKYAS